MDEGSPSVDIATAGCSGACVYVQTCARRGAVKGARGQSE